MGGERPLAPGEIDLACSIFGTAVDYAPVRIRRRKWFPFQPRKVVMAPLGHIHFHPDSPTYCDDFSRQSLGLQGFFIHEMTHVWQHQKGLFLPLRRMPWASYAYSLKPGWKLERYGIEQQAEIVRHAFVLQQGGTVPGAAEPDAYLSILPFNPS